MLKQQSRGGDLLAKFMEGCILDVTLENSEEHGPACPENCNHLLLLNEGMFLFSVVTFMTHPLHVFKADLQCSMNRAISLPSAFIPCRGTGLAFSKALCVVIVDSLCFSAVLLCPGTVQVAWE